MRNSARKSFLLAIMFLWVSLSVSAASASDQIYYFHNDHLGTPQSMSDAAGRKVWEAEYDPFGKATVNQDPDGNGQIVVNNLRFPGQYYDAETGLHYNYHRDYDPATGRYLQPDPIGVYGLTMLSFTSKNPFGFLDGDASLYAYVTNNPVNRVDPRGLAWFDNTSSRDIPFKPERDSGGYKEDEKYSCPSGITCDVDSVYPPGGGNPIKICDGCSASCSGSNIVIVCHTATGLLCQMGAGGPVPDDWWNNPKHGNWPLPGDPVSPAP